MTLKPDPLPLRNKEVRNLADARRWVRFRVNEEEDVIRLRKKGFYAGKRSESEWYFYGEAPRPRHFHSILASLATSATDHSSSIEFYSFVSEHDALRVLASSSRLGARKRRSLSPSYAKACAERLRAAAKNRGNDPNGRNDAG